MAQKFEESFYKSDSFTTRPQEISAEQLIELFLKNPSSADILKNVLGKK